MKRGRAVGKPKRSDRGEASFRATWTGQSGEWAVNHVRAEKEQVNEEIVWAGFVFVEEVKIEGLNEHYFLRFVKR